VKGENLQRGQGSHLPDPAPTRYPEALGESAVRIGRQAGESAGRRAGWIGSHGRISPASTPRRASPDGEATGVRKDANATLTCKRGTPAGTASVLAPIFFMSPAGGSHVVRSWTPRVTEPELSRFLTVAGRQCALAKLNSGMALAETLLSASALTLRFSVSTRLFLALEPSVRAVLGKLHRSRAR
jgi:hypothetical protein